MSVIRIGKRASNFVVLDKTCLQNPDLSWRAKGMHTYLMSLPQDWVIKISDLINRAPEGRDVVYGVAKELMRAGYLHRESKRDAQGCFAKNSYVIYEMPQPPLQDPDRSDGPHEKRTMKEISRQRAPRNQPHPEDQEVGKNPDAVTPDSEPPNAVRPTLLNNKITKYPNTKHPAAEGVLGNGENQGVADEVSAADFPVHTAGEFLVLGKTLSQAQRDAIDEGILHQLSAHPTAPKDLSLAICQELLNPERFSMAGRDFLKKLNTILKAIREGKWCIKPAPMLDQALKRRSQLSALCCALSTLHGESKQLQFLADHSRKRGQISQAESLDKQRRDCQRKITAHEQQLHAFQEAINARRLGASQKQSSHARAFASTPSTSQGERHYA